MNSGSVGESAAPATKRPRHLRLRPVAIRAAAIQTTRSGTGGKASEFTCQFNAACYFGRPPDRDAKCAFVPETHRAVLLRFGQMVESDIQTRSPFQNPAGPSGTSLRCSGC